jgi:membrane-associated phospholipid phosphatase
MKRYTPIILLIFFTLQAIAQTEPNAGNWRPWFIESATTHRLPAPPSYKGEVAAVLEAQQQLEQAEIQQIQYWDAGAPGYRWYNIMSTLWMTDASGKGVLANLLLGTAIYDATLVAWDTKYAYNRPRPFAVNKKIQTLVLKPESTSYPCEHSVAAGVAVTIISHFFPSLADSVSRLAQQAMASRVVAGVVFPSDTEAGFELGKKIAMLEIEKTKDFIYTKPWEGKIPQEPGLWTGKYALAPQTGLNKTVVLTHASELRPGPPPDFAKDMEELKNFKQTFSSRANAFHYASQPVSDDLVTRKIFEYNLQLNPPRAARLYAAIAVAYYDTFTACFEAKYAYWGIRPSQYDPTYKPLMQDPPFPGYPSGHAAVSGAVGELLSYFFPTDTPNFTKMATDAAESRFHAGIHFRSDNEVGLDLGRKVASKIVSRIKADGADKNEHLVSSKK